MDPLDKILSVIVMNAIVIVSQDSELQDFEQQEFDLPGELMSLLSSLSPLFVWVYHQRLYEFLHCDLVLVLCS